MASQTRLNQLNISNVLRTIWLQGSISRIGLAKTLSLDKSTVTKIVSQLIEIGIVETRENGVSEAKVGRPPIPVSINLSYGCIIGLEIQTDRYSAVIIDLNGRLVLSQTADLDFYDRELIDVFSEIFSIISLEAKRRSLHVLGVGVGISGLVDSQRGVILKSNPLRIDHPIPFRSQIEQRLGTPVFVDNDANCGCWGELANGKAERTENMLFVLGEFREVETQHAYYSGVGVGFGILVNGTVLHGTDFSVGEFKSIFLGDTPTISQFTLPDEDIANIESKPAQLDRLLNELCRNIAFIVNMLDLNEIVFGGALSEYKEPLTKKLDHLIRSNWLHDEQVAYAIRYSKFNGYSVAYGAASMFLENLFGVPTMSETNAEHQLRGYELLARIT